MPSIYEDILTRSQELIIAAALPGFPSPMVADVDVIISKLAALEGGIDKVPIVVIAPSDRDDEEVRRLSFLGDKLLKYKMHVVIINSDKKLLAMDGNEDANQDGFRWTEWRETIVNLFFDPRNLKSVVSEVRGTTVRPGRLANAHKWLANYNYTALLIEVRTQQ